MLAPKVTENGNRKSKIKWNDRRAMAQILRHTNEIRMHWVEAHLSLGQTNS